MSETLPIVSVIVPTYNRSRQLGRCLDALAQQDHDNARFEVIVVDDGSDQPVNGVVEPFADCMPVKLVVQRHANAAAARNLGADHARAPYLAFTDDDCVPGPGWLQTMVLRLSECSNRMYGGRTINNLTRNRCAEASQAVVDAVYEWHKVNPAQPRFFASNNIALAAELFHQAGGFDDQFRFAEDREFCDRWARCGFEMSYVPEAIVYHEHGLSLRGLLRQHFNYGRGAHTFHRVRESRGWGEFDLDGSFCLHLWQHALRGQRLHTCLSRATLVTAAQLANALGFLHESMAAEQNSSRSSQTSLAR